MPKLLTAHIHHGITLAVAAVLLLAGCGGSSQPSNSPNSAAEAPPGTSNGGAVEPTTKRKVSHGTQVAAARVGVVTITSCLREHGIKVPPQRVSAPVPVFNMKGIDTTTPKFRSAYDICFRKAIVAFKARLSKG